MFSEYKIVIKTAEICAIAGGLATCVSSAAVFFGMVAADVIESSVFVEFFAMLAVWFPAVLLAKESTRAIRGRTSASRNDDDMSGKELAALVRWCPRWLVAASISCAAVAFLIALPIGEIQWPSNEPFTSREAIGLNLGLAVFFFLAVPILASASRMPGAYEENFQRGGGNVA